MDGELVLDSTPDATGTISDYTYLTEGQHAIELRVEDSSGKISIEELVLRVGSENSIPACAITEPADSSAFVVGEAIQFRGTTSDEDIPSDQLSVEWISDKDGAFGNSVPSSSGNISFASPDLSSNIHTITMRVTDEIGASCSEQIVVAIGTPPTAAIDQPLDGEIYSVGDSIVFRGSVTSSDDLLNDIEVSWLSSIDGELQTGNANSQGISQFSSANLTAGVHSVSFTAVATTGLVADDLITFRVNTPPTIPIVTLSPDPIGSTQTLTAIGSGSVDDDGDNISYSYEWYENGILTSHVSSVIPSSELDVGEVWTVRVTPNDGYIDGNYTEESITISNSEPTIDSILISSSDGSHTYTDSVLTCLATASDADETVTPSYSWDINGTIAIGASIDLSNYSASVGDSISCIVSVSDSNGGSTSTTLAETIDNRAPSISAVSISPNPAFTNSSLTCSVTATDADGDSLTETFEWSIGGNIIGTDANVTLDASLVSPVDLVECSVTVTDSSGDSDTNFSSITISNTNPTIDSISLTPIEPALDDVLTCAAAASDLDGDSPALSFAFSNQTTGASYSSTTSSASSATLDLATISINSEDTVVCDVIATDQDNGSASDSVSVQVVNSAPEFSQQATITPSGSVPTDTPLTCSATASDPDGGSVSYSYTWQINGQTAATGTGFTTTALQTDPADSITCLVVAVDSDGEISSSTSAAVLVDNSEPEISSVTLNTLSPDTDTTLTTAVISSDLDGDSVTYSYEWHVVEALTGQDWLVYTGSGSSFSSLVGGFFSRDDEVYVIVTPNDGTTDGAAFPSAEATVLNTAPTTPTISLTSAVNPPMEGIDDLTCTISNISTDLDNDSITYTYNWYDGVSSTPVQTYANTTDTLDIFLGSGTSGGTWTCEVIASDGSLTATTSTTISIDSAWAGAINFNNCNQTGRNGPSQTQCDSSYSGGLLDGQVSVSSGIQSWVVPADGTYLIEAAGAEGGFGYGGSGGSGAYMSGEFNLTQGDVLNIIIGQQGDNAAKNQFTAGSGGGGSFVWMSTNTTTPLIAGGGGGGAGGQQGTSYAGVDGTTSTSGTAANGVLPASGGSSGQGGGSCGGGSDHNHGGAGGAGWLSDGAYSCTGSIGGGDTSMGGIAITGTAFGGLGSNNYGTDGGFGGGGGSNIGGGGGGGYSGGAAGNQPNSGGWRENGGGGGGSYNSGANQSNSSGGNTGHGYVIIDRL